MVVAEVAIVAKAKGRPRKPTGEGVPVRVDSDIVSKARYIAADRDVALSELFSELLRPIVEREFRRVGREKFRMEDDQ